MDTHGYGMASVRFICGTQEIHKQLEKKISEFHGTQDTILYSSCFDANGGVFEAILGADDALISDELNHASIIDGTRLCKSKRLRYKHMDMADLEKLLKESVDAPHRLIVTDGVFSMDGDIAPLPKIVDLANKYNAMIFVDESHATGFIGKNGKGTPEYFGVEKEIDIINSTLGKGKTYSMITNSLGRSYWRLHNRPQRDCRADPPEGKTLSVLQLSRTTHSRCRPRSLRSP